MSDSDRRSEPVWYAAIKVDCMVALLQRSSITWIRFTLGERETTIMAPSWFVFFYPTDFSLSPRTVLVVGTPDS